jgi:hypothetical protein
VTSRYPSDVTVAVEGMTDEAIAARLVRHVGGEVTRVFGLNGKPYLRRNLAGYVRAARQRSWLLLVDLDREADCAPELVVSWIGSHRGDLCFRVAVRAVEAWLLADDVGIASALGLPRGVVPRRPEDLADPKEALVRLAQRARHRDAREAIVPRTGSGRKTGPLYASWLARFVDERWCIERAALRAPSLGRALTATRRLVRGER